MTGYRRIGLCIIELIAAGGYAQTNEVVGFSRTPAPSAGSRTIISLTQFSGVETNAVNLQSAIPNLTNFNSSRVLADADKIHIWNPSSQQYEWYGLYAGNEYPFWLVSASSSWIFPFPPVVDNTVFLPRGSSVWFESGRNSSNNADIISAGAVYRDDTFPVDVPAGLSMLAYPYSAAVSLDAFAISNATASASLTHADKIHVWNSSIQKYDWYGLYAGGTNSFWLISTSTSWRFPVSATPSPREISLAHGFWFESGSAKTITFIKNYME